MSPEPRIYVSLKFNRCVELVQSVLAQSRATLGLRNRRLQQVHVLTRGGNAGASVERDVKTIIANQSVAPGIVHGGSRG